MKKALWNDQILAESDKTVRLEGNHYFPPEAVKRTHFKDSDHHTTCPWKGVASYYHIVVGDKTYENGAWYYPDPQPEAEHIKNHVAFYGGVKIAD